MAECTNCGAKLKVGQTRCPVCGVSALHRKSQRVCINCGTPAAQDAKICLMCGQPIDALPIQRTNFGSSWWALAIGLLLIAGIVYAFLKVETTPTVAVALLPSPTHMFVPPTRTPSPTTTPSPPPAPTLTLTSTPTPAPLYHKIRTGETLEFIANKYNITIDDLTAANDITRETILRVGQDLLIPNKFKTNTDLQDTRVRPIISYTVKSGDTLSDIAFNNGTSMSAIELANPNLDLDLLSVGQVLQVPLSPPTFTPTPTTTPTATFTPQPPFAAPHLLYPPDNAIIEGDDASMLLSWTSSGNLDDETFYVVHLTNESGKLRTFETHGTSLRLPQDLRPKTLETFSYFVVVMRKIGIDESGIFYGKALSNPSQTRTFQWR